VNQCANPKDQQMNQETDFRGPPLPKPNGPVELIEVRIPAASVLHDLRWRGIGKITEDPGIGLE
jgi:hypothetical protein